MAKTYLVAVALLTLGWVVAPRAQEPRDAGAVLRAASAAMGTPAVKTLQYTATGWNATMGQSYLPGEDWPKCELTSYTRAFNYDEKSSREEWTRIQGAYPPRGGGGIPIYDWVGTVNGVWTQKFYTNGEYAWNIDGNRTSVASRLTTSSGGLRPDVRQLDIWLSPHGFIKAAMAAADVSAIALTLDGQPKIIVTFTAMNKYRVNGTIGAGNLVERVQTWMPNAVFGDMLIEQRYSDYKDFGGVKVPMLVRTDEGDARVNPGHSYQEIKVATVQVNPALPPLAVPDSVRTAPPETVKIATTQLSPGLWRIAGESHHSFLVDFRDFVAVIEAPQDELRSLAVIAEVHRLAPGKPIKFVVNTHHHFDHSGGLRTYAAIGATIVTHATNKSFYENVLLYPLSRALEPDLLSMRSPYVRENRAAAIEGVQDKYVITDGTRTLEVYALRNQDEANHLVAYLPAEKMLFNADLYLPPAPNQPAPKLTTWMRQLAADLNRLKLDIAQDAGIHGGVVSHQVFLSVAGPGAGNQ